MQQNKFDDFAEISLSTFNLKNINIDHTKAIVALGKEIEAEYEELNSRKVREDRHKYFNISNTEIEDYAERILDLDNNRKVICGIRHLGGQVDQPFVNILSNFTTTKTELMELYNFKLSKYFAPFKPKHLRYYSKNKIASNEIRNSYLVQNAATIKKGIQFDLEKDLNLISPDNYDYYNNYKAEYEKFLMKNPNFKNIVQLNDLELMETSRKAGLLKTAEYKGETIGLIAGLKDDFLGKPAVYFIEILVNQGWKRKGFAKAIQRKFINDVCQEDEIVWGTIDMENQASIKTAKANLREEIRYENFMKLE